MFLQIIGMESLLEVFCVYDSVQVIKFSVNFKLGLTLVEIYVYSVLEFFVSLFVSDSVFIVLIELISLVIPKLDFYFSYFRLDLNFTFENRISIDLSSIFSFTKCYENQSFIEITQVCFYKIFKSISLGCTEGLSVQKVKVLLSYQPIVILVGRSVLGRLFNVLGSCVDLFIEFSISICFKYKSLTQNDGSAIKISETSFSYSKLYLVQHVHIKSKKFIRSIIQQLTSFLYNFKTLEGLGYIIQVLFTYQREFKLDSLQSNLVFSNKFIEKCLSIDLGLFLGSESAVIISVQVHKLEKFYSEVYYIIKWFSSLKKKFILVVYLFIGIQSSFREAQFILVSKVFRFEPLFSSLEAIH